MVEVLDYADACVSIPDCKGKNNTSSGLALWVETDDGEEHCIPHSQIHADSEVFRPGDEGLLVITRWIARKKGLTED